VETTGRRSAQVISAIGIVSVPLDLFRWNWNVLSVLSAFCVDVAVDVFDFCRIAVRVIATADGRMIGHAPCWIELLVQELILRGMAVKPSLTLSILRAYLRYQHAAKTVSQDAFAQEVHCENSLLGNPELRKNAVGVGEPSSGGVKSKQPSAISILARLEAVSALLWTEGRAPGVVPDETKLSIADRATLGCVVAEILGTVAHCCLLFALRG
jgi:hypothetical protein